jgi:hypothetical protein
MGRPAVEDKKQVFSIRLSSEMATEVRRRSPNLTAAVEQGLRLWLARERRKEAKADPLARHLSPPTAREIAARTKDGA